MKELGELGGFTKWDDKLEQSGAYLDSLLTSWTDLFKLARKVFLHPLLWYYLISLAIPLGIWNLSTTIQTTNG